MPKKRSTCTRCSMRRQKCDRNIPCARCIQNGEASICTTDWPDGYDPRIHRKYPKTKVDHENQRESPSIQGGYPTPVVTDTASPSQASPPQVTSKNATNNRPTNLVNSQKPNSQPSAPSQNPQDLEFITWGHAKLSEFNIDSHMGVGGLESRVLNLGNNFWQTKDDVPAEDVPLCLPAHLAEVNHLQSIIPSKEQVFTMVQYHENCLMWHHSTFNGPAFREELKKNYKDSGELQLQNLDWRWVALLFAILAGSSVCAPDSVTYTWGLTRPEKARLSRQWYHAITSSLMFGEFTSKYHVYSIQAIATSSLSAHVLGYSKQQLSLLSVAITIARGLSLHRISSNTDPELDKPAPALTPAQREALIQRETGRRIWWHICGQDWFCTTTTRMYSIQKRHFITTGPLHYNDEKMTLLPKGIPAMTHYTNHLHRLAEQNVEFFDAISDAPNTEAEYETVLRYDSKIRALYDEAPKFKSDELGDDPCYQWVKYANRGVELSHAHKVIKVNQFFLGRSFKDSRYGYSRWATITASKSIILELEKAYSEPSPSFWIEQAFMITACINLVLDILNRPEEDSHEVKEHVSLVQRAVNVLQRFPSSAIATHGLTLLSTLSKDRGKPDQNEQQAEGQNAANANLNPNSGQVYLPNKRQKRNYQSIFESPTSRSITLAAPESAINGSSIPPNVMPNLLQPDSINDGTALYPWYVGGELDLGDLLASFPPQSGLEGNNFFEDIFSLDYF